MLRRFAAHRVWSLVIVGAVGMGGGVFVGWIAGIPVPNIQDEFANLLMADTFASGRFSNPTHPMWEHFDTFQIIHQPTYQAKYPPGQSVFLALGQVVTGEPIWGVWLSLGLMGAAFCWMLRGWVPPVWAMIGALIICGQFAFAGYWAQGYRGGAVAAMAGAMSFGVLRRILIRPKVSHGVILGLSLVLLANSRPYEGFLGSLSVAIVLLVWLIRSETVSLKQKVTCVVIPTVVVLLCGGAVMMLYNYRVTGNPLRLPYQVWRQTYQWAPTFLWHKIKPEPNYRFEVMYAYEHAHVIRYLSHRSIAGLLRFTEFKLNVLWSGFLGAPLTFPLLMLPWMFKDRWNRFAMVVCGGLLIVLMASVVTFTHYAAPVMGLLYLLVIQGLRQIRLTRVAGRPTGKFLVVMIVLGVYVQVIPAIRYDLRENTSPGAWYVQRAGLIKQLGPDPDKHLVIVPRLEAPEWVYNKADIDGSKVVWAREIDRDRDMGLIDYFKGRRIWRLDFSTGKATLVPHPYVTDTQKGDGGSNL